MQVTLAPVIAVPIAVVAASAALGIWYLLLRPVPLHKATGSIEASVLVDAQDVDKTHIRSVRNPGQLTRQERYTVARHFLHTVRLDDGRQLRFIENVAPGTTASTYRTDATVEMTYTTRRIPFRDDKTLVSKVRQLP